MELGNKLIARGHNPADPNRLCHMRASHRGGGSGRLFDAPYEEVETRRERITGGLECIVLLTEWLNACPEAREVLAEMGVEWPVVDRDGVGNGPADPKDVLDTLTADQIAEIFDTMDPRDRVYCVHGWAEVAALEEEWRKRREQA